MRNKKKIGCFITVRTGSSRLPNKCLININGKKVIEHIIDRSKLSKKIDTIVLCTTTKKEDDILEIIAYKNKIKCFRGSVKDKLQRWNGAAKKYKVDYIVTFDGDDLFCDPELIDLAIGQMITKSCDMIKAPDNLICGAFTYCISAKALDKVCKIKDTDDTEMMWGFFTDTGLFKYRDLQVNNAIYLNKSIRLTLDYPEDLTFFKKVFEELIIKKNDIPLMKIIKFLEKKPSISQINYFRQNQFLQNQKNHTKIVLKKNIFYENK